MLANDHVNLTLKQGEIHALLGENGAGKSTLMNVLSGLYKQTSGTIKVYGEKVDLIRRVMPLPKVSAWFTSISCWYRPKLPLKNILLGLKEPRFFLNLSRYDKAIRELQEQFGLYVDTASKVAVVGW